MKTKRMHKRNIERAERAAEGISAYWGSDGEDEPSYILSDLLCDLQHWAQRNKVDFEAELQRAKDHYKWELERPED